MPWDGLYILLSLVAALICLAAGLALGATVGREPALGDAWDDGFHVGRLRGHEEGRAAVRATFWRAYLAEARDALDADGPSDRA